MIQNGVKYIFDTDKTTGSCKHFKLGKLKLKISINDY